MEYMGKSTTSSVYAAELRGMELAFQRALEVHATTNIPDRCTVFTDNQAAFLTTANPNDSRDDTSWLRLYEHLTSSEIKNGRFNSDRFQRM
jgi:hypothetical protein